MTPLAAAGYEEASRKSRKPIPDGGIDRLETLPKPAIGRAARRASLWRVAGMTRRLCVVGLGYVGLPTAAIFADAGLDVLGVDTAPEVVSRINSGTPHFVEPNLEALVRRTVEAGKLRAAAAPEPADVFVIAVPTPFGNGHRPDLGHLQAAIDALAPVLTTGNLVIIESTSPVGTTEAMAERLAALRPDLSFPQTAGDLSDIRMAHCPERVLPGRVIEEVTANDRVIGGMTRRCSAAAVAFYQHAVGGECHVTDARTAELAKLSENAFRDVNIAFANELSVVADRLGVNVWDLIDLANRHPRVNILRPGPGVGGHCVAVDPWFIVDSAPEESRLIRTAREINDAKPGWVVDRVLELARRHPKPVVACLGLAYKADIDDLRESPAVDIVHRLATEGSTRVLVAEPYVSKLPQVLEGAGATLADVGDAVAAAGIVVVLTPHRVFSNLRIRDLDQKTVFDVCGLFRALA